MLLIHGMMNAKSSGLTAAEPCTGDSKSNISQAPAKATSFGDVIRARRRELDLTQDEVAALIGTSTPYVGHLESGKRHPSNKVVTRLAEVLGLGNRELFLLANPHAEVLFAIEQQSAEGSAWKQFQKDEQLRRIHNVSNPELEMLSRVSMLGEVQSTRDLIHILNTVRHLIGR
jgi:transcriptional regulator with XRE-family HTH domain